LWKTSLEVAGGGVVGQGHALAVEAEAGPSPDLGHAPDQDHLAARAEARAVVGLDPVAVLAVLATQSLHPGANLNHQRQHKKTEKSHCLLMIKIMLFLTAQYIVRIRLFFFTEKDEISRMSDRTID